MKESEELREFPANRNKVRGSKFRIAFKSLAESLGDELNCKNIVISLVKLSILFALINVYIQSVSQRLDSVSLNVALEGA